MPCGAWCGADVDRAGDLLGREIDNQNALPRVRVPVVDAVTVDGDVRGLEIRRDREVVRRALAGGKRRTALSESPGRRTGCNCRACRRGSDPCCRLGYSGRRLQC